MKMRLWLLLSLGVFLLQGCATPKIRLFTDSTVPYKELSWKAPNPPRSLSFRPTVRLTKALPRGSCGIGPHGAGHCLPTPAGRKR